MTESAIRVDERAGDSSGVELSVVIPCRNGARTIAGQLESLAGQSWSGSWEVIISDNSSTDETVAVVESYRHRLPALRIVDSSDRLGVAHARNAGVAAAHGRSVVFCDDDDEVADGWLPAIAEALRKHEFVAASVETKELNRSWTRDPRQPRGLRNTEPPFLPYSFGASLGIRRALHKSIGGFDEDFVGGADDVDYCFRAQLYGAELHWVPEAIVHYRIRQDLRAIFLQGRAYSRGDVRLYKKYRPLGMRWQPSRRAVKFWVLCLPRLLLALHSRDALALWVWRLGRRVGFLQGSLNYRIVAF